MDVTTTPFNIISFITVSKYAFSHAFAGANAGATADMLVYGLDSYKVMMQSQSGQFKMSRIFRGVFASAFLGSAPSLFVFFGLYTPTKALLESLLRDKASSITKEKSISILPPIIASIIAGVPASLVAVPSDVVKKEMMLGSGNHISSAIDTYKHVFKIHGLRGLFIGWEVNLMKDIPFAGIKMTLYDLFCNIYIKYVTNHEDKNNHILTPIENAVIGFTSGSITGIVTCPMDVVNTRIKSGEFPPDNGIIKTHIDILNLKQHNNGGIQALFRGAIPRVITIGIGSTAFWWSYAMYNQFMMNMLKI